MPYGLLSICALLFFLSLSMQQQQVGTFPDQQLKTIFMENDAQTFISYRDALLDFQKKNPSFTGSVSMTQLQAIGYKFPSDFITKVGNAITQVASGSGRTITAFGNLEKGAISEILYLTENDASFGIALSNSWKSSAMGSSSPSVPLQTTVPDNNTVSVIQIGG